MPPLSSGTSGLSTSGDAEIVLLPAVAGVFRHEITIVNTGAAAGFVSIDGGETWHYMPEGPSSRTFDIRHAPLIGAVKAKRISGGSNMTGLYADSI